MATAVRESSRIELGDAARTVSSIGAMLRTRAASDSGAAPNGEPYDHAFIASTERLATDGGIIKVGAWDIPNMRHRWISAHDIFSSDLPKVVLGKIVYAGIESGLPASRVGPSGKALVEYVKYTSTDFAQDVMTLFSDGSLDEVSVRWDPGTEHLRQPTQEEISANPDVQWVADYVCQLELSAVILGADPGATKRGQHIMRPNPRILEAMERVRSGGAGRALPALEAYIRRQELANRIVVAVEEFVDNTRGGAAPLNAADVVASQLTLAGVGGVMDTLSPVDQTGDRDDAQLTAEQAVSDEHEACARCGTDQAQAAPYRVCRACMADTDPARKYRTTFTSIHPIPDAAGNQVPSAVTTANDAALEEGTVRDGDDVPKDGDVRKCSRCMRSKRVEDLMPVCQHCWSAMPARNEMAAQPNTEGDSETAVMASAAPSIAASNEVSMEPERSRSDGAMPSVASAIMASTKATVASQMAEQYQATAVQHVGDEDMGPVARDAAAAGHAVAADLHTDAAKAHAKAYGDTGDQDHLTQAAAHKTLADAHMAARDDMMGDDADAGMDDADRAMTGDAGTGGAVLVTSGVNANVPTRPNDPNADPDGDGDNSDKVGYIHPVNMITDYQEIIPGTNPPGVVYLGPGGKVKIGDVYVAHHPGGPTPTVGSAIVAPLNATGKNTGDNAPTPTIQDRTAILATTMRMLKRAMDIGAAQDVLMAITSTMDALDAVLAAIGPVRDQLDGNFAELRNLMTANLDAPASVTKAIDGAMGGNQNAADAKKAAKAAVAKATSGNTNDETSDQQGRAFDSGAREDAPSDAEKKSAVEQYGDVEFADEKNKKYPIDKAHVVAAWSYINKPANQEFYTSGKAGVSLESVKDKIKAAMKKFGHEVSDESDDDTGRAFVFDPSLFTEPEPDWGVMASQFSAVFS